MNIPIDFEGITRLMHTAREQGRSFLYEYEVYSLLSRSGAETVPKSRFIPRGARPSDEELTALPGDKAVLKIISPAIIHKTEVGGVRIVEKQSDRIRSAVRRMLYEVPENYATWIEHNQDAAPDVYRGLRGDALVSAISRDLKGVLQVQFMPPDSSTFGNELIVGLRHSREFGMVISAGLGGTDTELYAKRFRKGQAIVAASTDMNDGHSFFELFKPTIAYRKLAGLTRGQRRIVTDEQLIECFESFIQMANHFSPVNPRAPFIIEELEINPFAFSDYLMVPLDGMCRFSLPQPAVSPRPIHKIENFLHPESIGIIGVSSTRKNFGRIILENIMAEGFSKEKIVIIRAGEDEIDGVRCISGLGSLNELKNLDEIKNFDAMPENSGNKKAGATDTGSGKGWKNVGKTGNAGNVRKKLDLFIVAVGASQVPELVDQVISLNAAHSVMLIPGGMGETRESRERADQVKEKINVAHATPEGGPVFLGANCMGVISKPGGYDTWFIPEEKLPKERGMASHRAALISQSGAFMLHRTHQCPELRPAYMISMGNQTDLTLGDMVSYFQNCDTVDVIAVYAEGFNDLDGLKFCTAVHQAVLAGKEVIFYKAGRTPEGEAATSSHTASLAGDYMVCENCVRQAGAIVARTFTEFQELFFLAENLNDKKIAGNRLAAVSGAGFEAVGMADSIVSDDFQMHLAAFSDITRNRLAAILKEKHLDSLVTLANPLDINPAADDETHVRIAHVILEDPGVDALVISLDPLSPAMATLKGSGKKSGQGAQGAGQDERQRDGQDERQGAAQRDRQGSRAGVSQYDMDREQSIKNLMISLVQKSDKPVITVVDGGRLYDPLRDVLIEHGIPVFNVCDKAIAALSLYVQGRLAAEMIRTASGI